MKIFKKLALLMLVITVLCVSVGLSACGDDEAETGDVSVLFASEEDCPAGNIKDRALKSAIDFELNKTYYVVIDYTYTAGKDGNYADNLYADITFFPASNVSATLEETASASFSEKVVDDELNINIRYAVPEKAGKEKKIRAVVRIIPLKSQITYISASLSTRGQANLCTKGVTINDNFVNNLKFTLNADKTTYSLTGVTDTDIDGLVIIPSSYNGLKVTSISGAFNGCSRLTGVIIPNSIISIDHSAFKNCSKLTNLNIPDGVISIGSMAFCGCKGLKGIIIPSSVTAIGEGAFEYCDGIKSVTIPEGVKTIEKSTFQNCYGLTEVIIPASVKSIKENAFQSCSSLKNVFYFGEKFAWTFVRVSSGNSDLKDANFYNYSEEKPSDNGGLNIWYYWHYVNGVAVPW